MSVTKTTPKGPHRVGMRIVHRLAPGEKYETRCGLTADNGLDWCWCQWHWPGTDIEGGGDVAECRLCTPSNSEQGRTPECVR